MFIVFNLLVIECDDNGYFIDVFSFATLRIITYKSTSMGLIGTSSFTLALTLLLITVGTIHNIGFFKDIALALLLLGIVGTIAYAAVMRRA